MTTHVLTNVGILVGGYRIHTTMNSCQLSYAADELAATSFGDVTSRRIAGIKNVTAEFAGFYDESIESPLYSEVGLANTPVLVSPNNMADGSLVYGFLARAGEFVPLTGAVGEVQGMSISMESSGGSGLVRGTVMHNAVRTTSGNGVARQLGAVGAIQKLYAALYVLAASGSTPTLGIDVESDDNGAFSSGVVRGSFAQANAIGSEWLEIAGPQTDDYWRVNWTLGGGSPSFEFVVLLGIM